MQLEARDKRALIGGSVAVVVLLGYLLWPSAAPQSDVELVPPDQRGAATPAPAPVPVQTVVASPVAPVAAPVAAVPEGLTLTGVAGSGAIFSYADGTQRFIAKGRDVVPGLTLQGVTIRQVILSSGTNAYRLGFGGVATPMQAPIAPGAPGPALQLPPPASVPAPPLAAPASPGPVVAPPAPPPAPPQPPR